MRTKAEQRHGSGNFRQRRGALAQRMAGAAVWCAALFFATLAVAGDKKKSEDAKHQLEKAQEQAKKDLELAQEQMKKEYDKNKKEQENAFEKTKKSYENSKENDQKAYESGKKKESEERDGEEHSEKHDEGHAAGGHGEEEFEVPNTVEKLLRRWFEPEEKSKAAHTKGTKGQTGPGGLDLSLPSDREKEILAANVRAGTLERIRKLGFSVNGETALSRLKLTLLRLSPPPGMPPGKARRLLDAELPGETFAPNRIYRPYHAATGTKEKEDAGERPRTAAKPGRHGYLPPSCTDDRCYGAAAVRWQPQLSSCARKVRIGVIDTAIDTSHPAFAGRRIHSGVFHDSQPAADMWHGTGVLALLAGDPRSGTPGLVPDATFYAADVFFADENGQPATDTVTLLKALDWMEAWNVRVINMSLSGPHDGLIVEAITRLAQKGVVLTAAAGNGGPGAEASYPAAYEPVVAVTAIDRNMHVYRYANRGSYIDVAAPGVHIWTAMPGFKEGYQSGTSFAVPYVTAILAAVYDHAPFKTKEEILSRLSAQDLGPPGRDPVYGRGLLLAPGGCGIPAKDRIEQAGTGRPPPATAAAASPSGSGLFAPALSFGPDRQP